MSDVKITSVRAIATAPQGSNLIIVRIDTNQPGLYGYGCATYTQRFTPVLTVINDYMGKLLIGHDALNVNDAWEHMMNSSYWRNGPVLNNAISGCDMALWDIIGKAANMPVWQLWGGKVRQAVPVGEEVVRQQDHALRSRLWGLGVLRRRRNLQIDGGGSGRQLEGAGQGDPAWGIDADVVHGVNLRQKIGVSMGDASVVLPIALRA